MRRNGSRAVPAGEPLPDAITPEAFKTEVRFWADRLAVTPSEIHLVAMRRKWASCSPRGRVTFDATLLSQAEGFRREVVIHELLHLKVPNHGPLFSALLRTHLAGHQESP